MAPVDPLRFALDTAPYRSGDHAWVDELDRHVVHPGEPHHRMGTRAIDEAAWLRVDEHRATEIALRQRLVAEATDEVIAVRDGSEAACDEVAATVQEWLVGHHPETLVDWDTSIAHPLVRAGLAVQDDLCVMEHDGHDWRLTAAIVCFPTSWQLADKIGRPQGRIHEPVPHFDATLTRRVDTFFDRLAPGRIVSRRNWGITPHPLLFVPAYEALPRPEPWDVEHLWLRSERQTLRRLPRTGAVLFTIGVQLAPLTALRGRADVAARLLDTIERWPADLAADRVGPHDWVPMAPTWLREVAGDRADRGSSV